MSFQAMAWAVNQKTANSNQKFILLMLANFCNSETGQCNPSHKRLADDCQMSISTVKVAIKMLEELSLLTIIHRSSDGVSLPNQYRLNIDGVGRQLTEGGATTDRGVGRQTATNLEDKPVIKPLQDNGFALFWSTYPNTQRKGSKTKCEEVWIKKKLHIDKQKIIDHVESQKITQGWLKDDGQYVPAPLTYLNQRRWEGAEVSAQIGIADWMKGAI